MGLLSIQRYILDLLFALRELSTTFRRENFSMRRILLINLLNAINWLKMVMGNVAFFPSLRFRK